MKVTPLIDLLLIKSLNMEDSRGTFSKYWHQSLHKKKQVLPIFKEFYYSRSKKNVIRGMHFQSGNMAHDKLVTCIAGSVIDVVIDIRRGSATYGKVFDFRLSKDAEYDTLFIPKGFAHGFKSTSNETVMIYHVTSEYSPKLDTGIRYDSIDYDWGIEAPLVSERDLKLPQFDAGKTCL